MLKQIGLPKLKQGHWEFWKASKAVLICSQGKHNTTENLADTLIGLNWNLPYYGKFSREFN